MRQNRSWVAASLVGVGMLFLIDRFAWAAGIGNVFWSLAFFVVGAVLIALYRRESGYWWALFPGFAALGFGLAILAGTTGGLVLLALAGTLCLALYLTDRERRWGLLAGGVLWSLAIMAFFETLLPAADNGWWLFLGLAATFLALYLRRPTGAGSWNLFAAIALGAMALLSLFTGRIIETLIALVLLAGGGFMLWREATAREGPFAGGTGAPPAIVDGDAPLDAPPTQAPTARVRARSRWGRGSSG